MAKRGKGVAHYENQYFEGERPLFGEHGASLRDVTFGEGESPLKEGRDLDLDRVVFKWKYPLWYCRHVTAANVMFEEMSRSGIWYTDDVTVSDSTIQAPKQFRRCHGVRLKNVHFSDAEETLWTCSNVDIENVTVRGDYFGKDCIGVKVSHMDLIGNYVFDGGSDIEVSDSKLMSKDAFWNCENVTLRNCFIDGEYLAWNTRNLILENCVIESDQGLCYVEGLTMRNCTLIHTDLAFEYCSDIDAQVSSNVESIKNPINGVIRVEGVDELIMDETKIDPSKTKIRIGADNGARPENISPRGRAGQSGKAAMVNDGI